MTEQPVEAINSVEVETVESLKAQLAEAKASENRRIADLDEMQLKLTTTEEVLAATVEALAAKEEALAATEEALVAAEEELANSRHSTKQSSIVMTAVRDRDMLQPVLPGKQVDLKIVIPPHSMVSMLRRVMLYVSFFLRHRYRCKTLL